jgi:small GTP-binding protein
MDSPAKVVFLGDAAVGKTSLLHRATKQGFEPNYLQTVNSSHFSVSVPMPNGTVRLSLWDTAGQEVYRSFVPMFFRGAQVAVIVFDLSVPETFEHISEWISLCQTNQESECQFMIVGNKSDLRPWKVDLNHIESFIQNSGLRYLVTSASTGDGVEALVEEIAKMVAARATGVTQPLVNVSLSSPKVAMVEKDSGCC